MLASYLEAAQLELKVLLLIEQLLQSVGQDDVGVVKTAILLVKLVVLIVFHAGRHAVIGHGRMLVHIIASGVDEATSCLMLIVVSVASICRASMHPIPQKKQFNYYETILI